MSTSVATLTEWYDYGALMNATHMIVVCDTHDWEDYPVYITAEDNLQEQIAKHDGVNMQKIMEVYNFSMDRDEQLTPGTRVYNL